MFKMSKMAAATIIISLITIALVVFSQKSSPALASIPLQQDTLPVTINSSSSSKSETPVVAQPDTVGKFGCFLATPSTPRLVTVNGAKYARASAETWCDRNKTIKLRLRIAGFGISVPPGFPQWTINATANTHYVRSYDNPCAGNPGVRRGAYTIAELYDSAGTLIVNNTSASVDIDCS